MFWNKLFKREKAMESETVATDEGKWNQKKDVHEISDGISDTFLQENVGECNDLTENVQKDESKKEYHFTYALTTKEQQEKVIQFISPVKDDKALQNLMLSYCVQEEEQHIAIVRTGSENGKDDDTGKPYFTTFFAGLIEDECISVSYTSSSHDDTGELQYDVPKDYKEVFVGAFDLFRQWDKRNEFEKAIKASDKEFDLVRLNNELKKPLYQELKKMQNRMPKAHFEITCEEDARKLFLTCNTVYLYKTHDEETVNQFELYATDEKRKEWERQEYIDILQGIIQGNTDCLYKKLNNLPRLLRSCVKEPESELVDLYTEACQMLFAGEKEIPLECINSYLNLFTGVYEPFPVTELVKATEAYLKRKFAYEYEKGEALGDVQKLKLTCAEIKERQAELKPAENKEGFRFVLTEPDKMMRIVSHFMDKYQNMEAVKEEVAYLNCAYGIENEDLFLTAADEAADNPDQYWGSLCFIAILRGDVLDFRCRREQSTGELVPDYCDKQTKENWALFNNAIAFFRNKDARSRFFAEVEKTTQKNVRLLKQDAHNKLFAGFAGSFDQERNRIGDHPLRDVLIRLIELCEEKAPESGYQNTVIHAPAAPEKIREWEQNNSIMLPDDYKSFLLFADGVQVGSSSERLYGIEELSVTDEHLLPDYFGIGCMIGDGTTLVLSKSTGSAYVEDHGEYREYSNFTELLKYWIEFHA